MNEWRKILIPPYMSIKEAIEVINITSLQIALVIDENNKLLGTVTDGDVRRGIIKEISLEDAVEGIMNTNPITITGKKNKKTILSVMEKNKLRHLPVVDDTGSVIGLERLEDLLHYSKKENWIVIMAGGLGQRLKPLTDKCPKPMLTIEDKPILEIILANFIEQGFYQFYISVNYMAEQIKSYFGDGSKWGINIRYINEEKMMGTAGSLSLLPVQTDKPIIVMNGDILTKLNFEQLINYHLEHRAQATVAVRAYSFQIPYGVVKINKDRLAGFEEKPIYTSFINAGIYVFNPSVLKKIPVNSYFNMNQLLELMLENNEQISIFPVREYWVDIGTISDFNQAKLDFYEVFK
ncbi:MAG: CBS domain-containing protein [Clostridiaceae bacterium]|nr:CBS domain-containing protein [Clostridiaceae bacterium]